MSVSSNVMGVRERIDRAARAAGRSPQEIVFMAVSKNQPAERIREAYAAGLRVFGENRVQEFAGKIEELKKDELRTDAVRDDAVPKNDLRDVEFHLIGHLQSNKAAKAAELFRAVDSVDSLRIAEKLNAAAQQMYARLDVLIEVNVGGEAAKNGVASNSPALEELLLAAPRLQALSFRGLMTVPPFTEDPEGARPYFRKLHELRDSIAHRKLPGIFMEQLSMGMSHDFEIAIAEGSTCVRIGTAIFGKRAKA
jgi:pyridoxal phosphate enzyme (YggS family)